MDGTDSLDADGDSVVMLFGKSRTPSFRCVRGPRDHCLRLEEFEARLLLAGQGLDNGLIDDLDLEVSQVLASGSVTLSGTKFNDRDADGVMGPGEVGMPGWTIELDLDQHDGPPIRLTTTTDIHGNYEFANLSSGLARIREIPGDGWTRTLPADSGEYTVDTSTGTSRFDLDYGAYLSVFTGIVAGSVSLGNGITDLVAVNDYSDPRDSSGSLSLIDLGGVTTSELQPGDADQDLDFDQLDLVRVLQVGKYLTGEPATWSEGDWDGGPGGQVGRPPAGDGVFDQRDIIAAMRSEVYLAGPYGVISPPGVTHDIEVQVVELPTSARPQSVVAEKPVVNQPGEVSVASIGDPRITSNATNAILSLLIADGGAASPERVALKCDHGSDACNGPIDIETASLVEGELLANRDVMVSANFRSDTISILQTDESGQFGELSPVQHLSVPPTPIAVSLGPIDGDTITDIAVASFHGDSVSILKGNDTGEFKLDSTIGGFRSPTDVLLSDLDASGELDLIVTNYATAEVSVLLNRGNGQFGAKSDFNVGLGPQSVAAGFLNDDDHVDLAVANAESGTISVLLGDGDGRFGQRIDFGLPPIPGIRTAAGQSPQVVRIGEFDGAGRMDIVVAHFLGGVSIHLNGVDDRKF